MSRTYPALDEQDRAALQAFADAHASDKHRKEANWKDELSMIYWFNARIWRDPMTGQDIHGTTLHGIRNNFGPTWLYDVCDIKPITKPKPKKA